MSLIWLYIASGLISLATCFFAAPIGRVLGVIDAPDGQRKLHVSETPLVGGLAIMSPLLLAALYFAYISEFMPILTAFAGATFSVLILGLVDDRRHIKPYVRLSISLVICGLVLYGVPAINVTFLHFTFLDQPIFLDRVWAVVFTLLCLVGLQNAINMADGKNGLVMGMTLIWVLLLTIYSPMHIRPLLIVFAVGLCVALGFNLGGRLFLGDSGAYSISLAIGMLAIYAYKVGFDRLPADIVALWFLIPVVDCLRLMVSRMVGGRSPFSSDRNHLHHMLLEMMPWRWALTTYLGLVGIPAVFALFYPALTLWWGVGAFAIYVLILALRGRRFMLRNSNV